MQITKDTSRRCMIHRLQKLWDQVFAEGPVIFFTALFLLARHAYPHYSFTSTLKSQTTANLINPWYVIKLSMDIMRNTAVEILIISSYDDLWVSV
jgi:hypothetical protein